VLGRPLGLQPAHLVAGAVAIESGGLQLGHGFLTTRLVVVLLGHVQLLLGGLDRGLSLGDVLFGYHNRLPLVERTAFTCGKVEWLHSVYAD